MHAGDLLQWRAMSEIRTSADAQEMHYQDDDENDQENIEKRLRDPGCRARNTAEAQ